ncbi:MAG TPA: asparagine synthase (glutamine-hydrolyzing) [Chitinophagaceae bacterium]|nr:asparagine synthase (glutamine-hydrolyzing) [Chitinophagaceae bacterium]
MCGIAGIINSPARTETGESRTSLEKQLHEMAQALKHRGPEDERTWISPNGQAGLAHRRLSIIDLSPAAAQPMGYLDRYTMVHNGEIYNYPELKNELHKIGYSFRSQSDSEVILAAYDYWEKGCLEHFDGMFAFAIWDDQEKTLFAARDRFGEKPFFYFYDQNTFVFGSEMKALWKIGIEKQVNYQMLFNFITIGYTDNPAQPDETFYENIYKLPAASYLLYSASNNEIIVERYWDIDSRAEKQRLSEKQVFEQFDNLFTTSIQRRLRSDVSIGTSLSGGLDSSAVIATCFKTGEKEVPLNAFTAVFPGFHKDESIMATKVAQQFGLSHHTVAVQLDELLDDWDRVCYHQEEPFGSASIYAQFKVYELASKHHVKVLLDGQGADETLAGYHKYYKWYWQELFLKRKLLRSGELKAARKLGVEEDFGFRNVVASLFPDLASVMLERRYLLKALSHEDLTTEFVKQQSKEAYYTTPEYFNLDGALYFNTCVHGLEELLRFADRNSMAHGCEVRLPFLNHSLVEFIFSLPSDYKIRQGWTKWLLRNSMKQTLPAETVWRKDKVGFEPPQQEWMRNKKLIEAIYEARKKMVREKILKPSVLEKPVLPLGSHAADNFDWRYFSAAAYI